MNIQEMKKGICTLKLEKLQKVYNNQGIVDPTLLRCTFSIIDFNASGNKQIISKQVALDSAPTLKFKPLLCQYKETDDYDNPNDDFGDHGEYEGKLRDGSDYVMTDTHAIGVAEKEGYLGVIQDDNGNDIDVLLCDFVLWVYRYPNECGLINEFFENNEPLYSSCEFYYKSNNKDDEGNEIIDSLIFDGHCALGRMVEPAFESSRLISFNSKWNKAVNQCIKKNNTIDNIENEKIINEIKEDDENIMENKIFELLKSNNSISAGSIRWRIYDELSKVMVAEVYNNMYLSEYDIYPEEHYFVYETYIEGEGWKLFKCGYSVDENDNVTVDYEGRQAVQYKTDLQPIQELQVSLNSKDTELETAKAKIEELEKSLNEKDEEIKTLTTEKVEVVGKFNNATDLATSLNAKVDELTSKVETMQPLIDKYNEEQYEKALNSAKEDYKAKFEKVGAIEIFEQEETLELIKKSINSKVEESNEAKFQLNQLIIDNIKGIKIEEENIPMAKSINSVIEAKETKNLVKDFEDLYEEYCGFNR